MKSISIHGLNKEAADRLRKRAQTAGKSVNKTVKEILEKALGVAPAPKDHREDFIEFLGIWTKEESKKFHEAVEDMEKVDPGEWK